MPETLALVVKKNFTLRLYNSKANLLSTGLIVIIPIFTDEETDKKITRFSGDGQQMGGQVDIRSKELRLGSFSVGSHRQHLSHPGLNVAKRL